MGQEIQTSQFSSEDFERFKARLSAETALLQQWLERGQFSHGGDVGGFELESWLVDKDALPAPVNELFLERLDSPLASPELARFNVEVNSTPRQLSGSALRDMHDELLQTWAHCRATAASLDADLVMIGILPTVTSDMLSLANMSNMRRYRALNQQVFRLRHGKPMELNIKGEEHLQTVHRNVMLEAAATSFQIHLKVTQADAVRVVNAAMVLSAPMVALCANSPFLFGANLWDETRIPLFEQAVMVGGYDGAAFGPIRRVTFGNGYLRESPLEWFRENLEHYPVLLPMLVDDPPERLSHLRLHNGTIWRWNRPLVGFDEDGTPHLRVEHRVCPAGPSVVDTIANAALFYGAVYELARTEKPLESKLDFGQARDNFYQAAKRGLRASIKWVNGETVPIRQLLKEYLLPLAYLGLEKMAIDRADIDAFLDIVAARLESGRNGALWQREYVARHSADMRMLTEAYLKRQNSGLPVHEWDTE
ncbi:MAG: glutamate--cysteine ligase [Gammaproteobacteria bacterium SG8_47]|nr:MAG: glutamate--cysteine ligase [Gammaproteobacteria bacterium SG8_47]